MSNKRPTMTHVMFMQVTGSFHRRSTAIKNHRQTGADFPWYVVRGQ